MTETEVIIQDKVAKAREAIICEIDVMEEQLELLKKVDFTHPVTEDTWHKLCDTPLRGTQVMKILVQNIFHSAEDIEVWHNYVCFVLEGFKIQIPTSRQRGINVDLGWYVKDEGEPKVEYSASTMALKNYFEAVDTHAPWYECMKYIIPCHSKIQLFLKWVFLHKMRKPDRNAFEERLKAIEEHHKNAVEKYRKERDAVREKTDKLLNVVLPVLETFSKEHCAFNGQQCRYSIEQIKEYENMQGEHNEI